MKHVFTIICFMISGWLLAQTDLYVSNNTDAYIYVDGTGFSDASANVAPLYVTNNIELAGADSHLYLRNEAQLLQSASSTGNSGTGLLSVYQEGNSSEYQYNYWCSPIGSQTASSTSNPFGVSMLGDVVDVRNATPAIITHNASYNGLANPLTIEERWIYTYTNPSHLYSDWQPIFNANTISPGEGFTMKGTAGTSANNPGNNQRYDFRGKPNTGTFTMNVAAPVAGEDQQTLVGNPYPSAMDALLFIHDAVNTNATDGVLYYWEQVDTGSHLIREYEGGYSTYTINAAGTVETFVNGTFSTFDGAGNDNGPSGGSGVKTARRYIPIGQGFMVQGRVGSTGTVRTTNDMRVFYKETSSNSTFFRTTEESETNVGVNNENHEIEYNEYGLSIVPDDYKRFRINVEFDNLYKRQLVQNFHHTATDGFDRGLEAKRPEGPASDASWTMDGEPYVIQAQSFSQELKIPLVINLDGPQPVGFSIFDIQNFDESQPIYIHDIEANLYVDLRAQDYEINLPAGHYSDRFEVTFTEDALYTPEVTASDFDVFQDNIQSQLTILNPKGLNVKNVRLFDTAGKMVFNALPLSNETAYRFSTKALSDGVYVTTITLADNQMISKKVIVKN